MPAIAAVAALTLAASINAGEDPSGPMCHAPPPDASPKCVDCYVIECIIYLEAYEMCGDDFLCRAAAKAAYLGYLGQCPCGVKRMAPEFSDILTALPDWQRRDMIPLIASF